MAPVDDAGSLSGCAHRTDSHEDERRFGWTVRGSTTAFERQTTRYLAHGLFLVADVVAAAAETFGRVLEEWTGGLLRPEVVAEGTRLPRPTRLGSWSRWTRWPNQGCATWLTTGHPCRPGGGHRADLCDRQDRELGGHPPRLLN